MRVYFVVPGAPQGKARARTVMNKYTGKIHSYTPDKTAAYEEEVAIAYRSETDKGFGSDAIMMYIDAYYPIPKSFTKAKKKAAACGDLLPTVKPDIDNIAKIICDALNGLAFSDDKQIVYMLVKKAYSSAPRVEVTLVSAEGVNE